MDEYQIEGNSSRRDSTMEIKSFLPSVPFNTASSVVTGLMDYWNIIMNQPLELGPMGVSTIIPCKASLVFYGCFVILLECSNIIGFSNLQTIVP